MSAYGWLFLLFINSTQFFGGDCQFCSSKIESCELKIPKNPIYNAVIVPRSGVSQQNCVEKLESFHWSIGIYCQSSSFCGMGLDLKSGYNFGSSGGVAPVDEVCDVIVDRSKFECASLKSTLIDAGVLRCELRYFSWHQGHFRLMFRSLSKSKAELVSTFFKKI